MYHTHCGPVQCTLLAKPRILTLHYDLRIHQKGAVHQHFFQQVAAVLAVLVVVVMLRVFLKAMRKHLEGFVSHRC